MRYSFTLLLSLLLSSMTFAQLDLEELEIIGECINMKIDQNNELHLLEYVGDSIEVDGEWYANTALYSKYDENMFRIFSTPILTQVSNPREFGGIADRTGALIHIDEENETRIIIRMKDSLVYDGVWYAPDCSRCQDLYYIHFDANGQKLDSRRLNYSNGDRDGGHNALAFDSKGNLSVTINNYTTTTRVYLPSGDTLFLDTPSITVLMRLDDDFQLDTLRIVEGNVTDLQIKGDFYYTTGARAVCKYNRNWDLIWKKEFYLHGAFPTGIRFNPDGSMSFGGAFRQYFAIDQDTSDAFDSWDSSIINLSDDGEVNWTTFIYGDNQDYIIDLASDRFGNNYYLGRFSVNQQFGDSLYQIDSGIGQVLGKYVNGQPVQSFFIPQEVASFFNWTFFEVSDRFVYIYDNGHKGIYRFCIPEADEDCNGFLVDTEEVLSPELIASFSPNPTTGLIDIQSELPLNNVQLFDAVGRQLPLQSTDQQISLEHLPPGIYYLTYQLKRQHYATKLMKL